MKQYIELQDGSKSFLVIYNVLEELAQEQDGVALKIGAPISREEENVISYGSDIVSISHETGRSEVKALYFFLFPPIGNLIVDCKKCSNVDEIFF